MPDENDMEDEESPVNGGRGDREAAREEFEDERDATPEHNAAPPGYTPSPSRNEQNLQGKRLASASPEDS